MRILLRCLASAAALAGMAGLAARPGHAECNTIHPEATWGPNAAFNNPPPNDVCYILWPYRRAGPQEFTQREAECRRLPGFIEYVRAGSSNLHLCLFRRPVARGNPMPGPGGSQGPDPEQRAREERAREERAREQRAHEERMQAAAERGRQEGRRAIEAGREQGRRDQAFPDGPVYFGPSRIPPRLVESDRPVAGDGCDNPMTAISYPERLSATSRNVATACRRPLVVVVDVFSEHALERCTRQTLLVQQNQPIALSIEAPPLTVHACFLGTPGCASVAEVRARFGTVPRTLPPWNRCM